MNKKQTTTFVIVSIVLLLGVFFALIFVSLFGGGVNTNFEQVEDSSGIQYIETDNDPLITSAEDIYTSLINETDPVLGKKNAKLTILEFGDFECPYCLAMSETLNEVLPEFDGQVSLVWKDFPNPVHLQARDAALSARCADEQGKFWEYYAYLFTNQDNLSRELYSQVALGLDLDLAQFNNCLETGKYIEKVGEGLVDGQKLEVDATPYLFIGNTRVDSLIDKENLRGIIRRELAN